MYPDTRPQGCWLRKAANILNKLPRSVQPKVRAALHEIWIASTHAREFLRQEQEAMIASGALNKMTSLGIPQSHRSA